MADWQRVRSGRMGGPRSWRFALPYLQFASRQVRRILPRRREGEGFLRSWAGLGLPTHWPGRDGIPTWMGNTVRSRYVWPCMWRIGEAVNVVSFCPFGGGEGEARWTFVRVGSGVANLRQFACLLLSSARHRDTESVSPSAASQSARHERLGGSVHPSPSGLSRFRRGKARDT